MEDKKQHFQQDDTIWQVVYILGQLIKDDKQKDQKFIEALQVVSQSQIDENIKQQADIKLAKILDFIENQYNLMKDSEEQKMLIPIKIPKVHRLYVDGCFDLMHSGHFNALRQAKELCEVLVCGVIAQDEITKRKGTPVMNLEERLILAESCKWVDEICLNAPYDPTIELIDKLKCSHVGHGDDLVVGPNGEDAYGPFKKSNRMIVFKRTEGISTTDIVGRLLLMSKAQPNLELKRLRKNSGEQGLLARDVTKEQITKMNQDEIKENSDQDILISPKKVQLFNTSRRIQQFFQGNRAPKPEDKIVYIDGCFDMLHIGHIKTIKKAKSLGTYLIVGIHDDDVISKFKGNNYPVLSLQERVLCVLALKYVDDVIIGAPWVVTEAMIKQFNISIVVQGTLTKGYNNKVTDNEHDPYKEAKKLGKYTTIQSESQITTEVIIERIIAERMRYLEIYKKKALKEEQYYNATKRDVQEI